MALPNFRLFETQARWSFMLSMVALVGVSVLSYLVFRGFDWQHYFIPYNPGSMGTLAKMRETMIFAGGGFVVVVGLLASGMGYSSLGEKRNKLQRASWGGLLLGSLCSSLACIDLFAWIKLKEAI
jgi:multisubunit Na+/H+ antiporter MnhB subunit